jgi:hypothetical protein
VKATLKLRLLLSEYARKCMVSDKSADPSKEL